MEIINTLFDRIFYSFWTWLGTFLIVAVIFSNVFTLTKTIIKK